MTDAQPKTRMTSEDITRRLIVERYARSQCVIPRYTPKGWWECDVFEITKAGYFREYEIKLTLADFRAERNKVREEPKFDQATGHYALGTNGNIIREKVGDKLESLAARSDKGPSKFFYVFPEGVIPLDLIPEWAGAIIARPFGDRHPYKVSLTTVKPAPRLHNKPPAVKRESVYETAWWRFMRLYLYTRDAEEPAKVE